MVLWALQRSVFNVVWSPEGVRRELRFSGTELQSESAKYSVAIRRLGVARQLTTGFAVSLGGFRNSIRHGIYYEGF